MMMGKREFIDKLATMLADECGIINKKELITNYQYQVDEISRLLDEYSNRNFKSSNEELYCYKITIENEYVERSEYILSTCDDVLHNVSEKYEKYEVSSIKKLFKIDKVF